MYTLPFFLLFDGRFLYLIFVYLTFLSLLFDGRFLYLICLSLTFLSCLMANFLARFSSVDSSFGLNVLAQSDFRFCRISFSSCFLVNPGLSKVSLGIFNFDVNSIFFFYKKICMQNMPSQNANLNQVIYAWFQMKTKYVNRNNWRLTWWRRFIEPLPIIAYFNFDPPGLVQNWIFISKFFLQYTIAFPILTLKRFWNFPQTSLNSGPQGFCNHSSWSLNFCNMYLHITIYSLR